MSDTPRTDAEWSCSFFHASWPNVSIDFARQLERELAQTNKAIVRLLQERDENKAGWDRASLTALDIEQRLKRAEKCIGEIEAHYKSKHGESYDHTTLNTIITSWRERANTSQN